MFRDETLQQLFQLIRGHAVQRILGNLVLNQFLDLGDQSLLIHLFQLSQQLVQLGLQSVDIDALQRILQIRQCLFDILLSGSVFQLLKSFLDIIAVDILQLADDLLQILQLSGKCCDVDLLQGGDQFLEIIFIQLIQNLENIVPLNVKACENLQNLNIFFRSNFAIHDDFHQPENLVIGQAHVLQGLDQVDDAADVIQINIGQLGQLNLAQLVQDLVNISAINGDIDQLIAQGDSILLVARHGDDDLVAGTNGLVSSQDNIGNLSSSDLLGKVLRPPIGVRLHTNGRHDTVAQQGLDFVILVALQTDVLSTLALQRVEISGGGIVHVDMDEIENGGIQDDLFPLCGVGDEALRVGVSGVNGRCNSGLPALKQIAVLLGRAVIGGRLDANLQGLRGLQNILAVFVDHGKFLVLIGNAVVILVFLPLRVQGHVSRDFDLLLVSVSIACTVGLGVPAAEHTVCLSEGVGSQSLLLILGEDLIIHLALAAVGVKAHGVGGGRRLVGLFDRDHHVSKRPNTIAKQLIKEVQNILLGDHIRQVIANDQRNLHARYLIGIFDCLIDYLDDTAQVGSLRQQINSAPNSLLEELGQVLENAGIADEFDRAAVLQGNSIIIGLGYNAFNRQVDRVGTFTQLDAGQILAQNLGRVSAPPFLGTAGGNNRSVLMGHSYKGNQTIQQCLRRSRIVVQLHLDPVILLGQNLRQICGPFGDQRNVRSDRGVEIKLRTRGQIPAVKVEVGFAGSGGLYSLAAVGDGLGIRNRRTTICIEGDSPFIITIVGRIIIVGVISPRGIDSHISVRDSNLANGIGSGILYAQDLGSLIGESGPANKHDRNVLNRIMLGCGLAQRVLSGQFVVFSGRSGPCLTAVQVISQIILTILIVGRTITVLILRPYSIQSCVCSNGEAGNQFGSGSRISSSYIIGNLCLTETDTNREGLGQRILIDRSNRNTILALVFLVINRGACATVGVIRNLQILFQFPNRNFDLIETSISMRMTCFQIASQLITAKFDRTMTASRLSSFGNLIKIEIEVCEGVLTASNYIVNAPFIRERPLRMASKIKSATNPTTITELYKMIVCTHNMTDTIVIYINPCVFVNFANLFYRHIMVGIEFSGTRNPTTLYIRITVRLMVMLTHIFVTLIQRMCMTFYFATIGSIIFANFLGFASINPIMAINVGKILFKTGKRITFAMIGKRRYR